MAEKIDHLHVKLKKSEGAALNRLVKKSGFRTRSDYIRQHIRTQTQED